MTSTLDLASAGGELEVDEPQLVSRYLARSRAALRAFRQYDQAAVDDVVTAVAWAICNRENAARLAQMEFDESQMGNVADKTRKNTTRVLGNMAQLRGQKSVGVLDSDPITGITRIAKPKGVFAAFIPVTNSVPTLTQNAMALLKGRNTVIFSPPRRVRKATREACDLIRSAIARVGGPPDAVLLLDQPTRGVRDEMMRGCDVVMATGGGGLVRAAYSSGRPAIGVGPGNPVTVIDGTSDVNEAVEKIVYGKTFDYATGCSAESSVVIHESVYEVAMKAFASRGGQRLTDAEAARLESVLWRNGRLNEALVGRSPRTIAEAAGLNGDATFFLVESAKPLGAEHTSPFAGEKLSVVLTAYSYGSFTEAITRVGSILEGDGRGHSCGIHTTNASHVAQLAEAIDVCRVLVNQVQATGNSGSFGNGLPFTATLGCGSWGGNAIDENVTWQHGVNITRVSHPIPERVPTEKEVFGDFLARYGSS